MPSAVRGMEVAGAALQKLRGKPTFQRIVGATPGGEQNLTGVRGDPFVPLMEVCRVAGKFRHFFIESRTKDKAGAVRRKDEGKN